MNNDGVRWAREFHELYEQLAPSFGYETRHETREFDPQSANGRLMSAVCKQLIVPLESRYHSAVRTLQDIVLMGGPGSESAAHRLAQLGESIHGEQD